VRYFPSENRFLCGPRPGASSAPRQAPTRSAPVFGFESKRSWRGDIAYVSWLFFMGIASVAIANNGGLSDPAPISFNSQAETGTSKVQTGTPYLICPKPTSGAGTKDDPFGLPDLLNTTTSPVTQGPALTILRPGDTLYFIGGNYHIRGSTTANYWGSQLICPTVSGTTSQPITVRAYPGQTVRIFEDAGSQPVFGTESPTLSYVRFLGFTIEPTATYTSGRILEVASPFRISGTGNEVAFCEVIGRYAATSDNHDGIRLDDAGSAWIHHNIVHGIKGDSHNSAGIKVYKSTNLLIEDNYVHDCTVGVYDKDAGLVDGTNQPTYRRNYLTNNDDVAFQGNNQGALALFRIYDNVLDGPLELDCNNSHSEIHHNLIRTNHRFRNMARAISGAQSVWSLSLWDNIVISRRQSILAYADLTLPFTPRGAEAPLEYMDYNVYDGPPRYSFGEYTRRPSDFTLSQMRTQGFERHSKVVASASSIFWNLTAYQLRPQWTTAGRNGDPVGPRFSIAQILATSRYGPQALGAGSSPAMIQQPENQSAAAGGRVFFSVQVSGSGPLYQWQRSNDGGNTWTNIQGANLAAYTLPKVTNADNGAVFRCLAACVGGSVWSNFATLTVSTADPIVK
jgi:hypothetical protein